MMHLIQANCPTLNPVTVLCKASAGASLFLRKPQSSCCSCKVSKDEVFWNTAQNCQQVEMCVRSPFPWVLFNKPFKCRCIYKFQSLSYGASGGGGRILNEQHSFFWKRDNLQWMWKPHITFETKLGYVVFSMRKAKDLGCLGLKCWNFGQGPVSY